MCLIYVVDEHQQVLDIWRNQNAQFLRVLHLDAHCDMRGLLINRRTQYAYRVWDPIHTVDQGNFLTHALLEGRISSLRWVYNEKGGRRFDVGTVKYESDLSAVLYCIYLKLRGYSGIPLRYDVMPYENFKDLERNEVLDIDWDFFAGIASTEEMIKTGVRKFLEKEFSVKPKQIYVCYSPEYSIPSRRLFNQFISDLAEVYHGRIIPSDPIQKLPQDGVFYRKYKSRPLFRLARWFYYSVNLSLRRIGIY